MANPIKNAMSAISAGSRETDSLGPELAAKNQMIETGRQALKGGPASNDIVGGEKKAPMSGKPEGWEKVGQGTSENRIDSKSVNDWRKPLGSFKKGGTVPKTGVYKLHKDEEVIPAEEAKEKKSGSPDEHSPAEKAHFHRAMSKLHAGGLHDHLGISRDKKIPLEKKQEAANSDNPHVAAMGRMAVAMHGWGHTGSK